METTRAYDFTGTHLPIYRGGFPDGVVENEPFIRRQRVTPYGPGLALAQPLVVPHFDEQGEHVLDIEIGIGEGRPACLALRSAHGRPLTTTLLRTLALGEVVVEQAARKTFRVHRAARGRYVGVLYSEAFRGMLGFGDERAELDAEVRSRPRVIDDAFLDRVARVYREAVADGIPPAVALQKNFGGVERESARRWVSLARKAGKLGPPLRGRAGESDALER